LSGCSTWTAEKVGKGPTAKELTFAKKGYFAKNWGGKKVQLREKWEETRNRTGCHSQWEVEGYPETWRGGGESEERVEGGACTELYVGEVKEARRK